MGIGDWIKNAIQPMPENPDELFLLGLKYRSGEDGGQDLEKANKYFEAAAKHGHTAAADYLAESLRYGIGTKRDIKRAIAIYEEAEKAGSAEAACCTAGRKTLLRERQHGHKAGEHVSGHVLLDGGAYGESGKTAIYAVYHAVSQGCGRGAAGTAVYP